MYYGVYGLCTVGFTVFVLWGLRSMYYGVYGLCAIGSTVAVRRYASQGRLLSAERLLLPPTRERLGLIETLSRSMYYCRALCTIV